mmetsp:Transcript_54432/g.125420  ORF Transcript_54432/g.125420 Transcript_54432/m.125420 type:complete len:269 (+) Transcript_54432:100-906(+)
MSSADGFEICLNALEQMKLNERVIEALQQTNKLLLSQLEDALDYRKEDLARRPTSGATPTSSAKRSADEVEQVTPPPVPGLFYVLRVCFPQQLTKRTSNPAERLDGNSPDSDRYTCTAIDGWALTDRQPGRKRRLYRPPVGPTSALHPSLWMLSRPLLHPTTASLHTLRTRRSTSWPRGGRDVERRRAPPRLRSSRPLRTRRERWCCSARLRAMTNRWTSATTQTGTRKSTTRACCSASSTCCATTTRGARPSMWRDRWRRSSVYVES